MFQGYYLDKSSSSILLIMKVKAILMPYIASMLSSDALSSVRHFIGEAKAKLSGNWPTLEVYLHVSDPYSFVLLQALPELAKRYNVNIVIFWLGKLQDEMFPAPEMLNKYAYQDAQYLAELYDLKPLPSSSADEQPQLHWSCYLQQICFESNLALDELIQRSLEALKSYWQGDIPPNLPCAELSGLQKTLIHNSQRHSKLGHYLPATLYFAGDWYWGLDRLDHLEDRLNHLGLNNPELNNNLATIEFNKTWQLPDYPTDKVEKNKPLTLYWSARSPYSYLALLRTAKLAEKYTLNLIIKPVMPMMMRNMAVPHTKKMYIFRDTKREANKLGIPYGKVADPLGEAVKRCYALLDYARRENKYLPFLLSFAKAVNAEGIRAETDQGLQKIVERAGLSWQQAKSELSNESWKAETANNLAEMNKQGLWGVPGIQYKNAMYWGQDRLGRIEEQICQENQV